MKWKGQKKWCKVRGYGEAPAELSLLPQETDGSNSFCLDLNFLLNGYLVKLIQALAGGNTWKASSGKKKKREILISFFQNSITYSIVRMYFKVSKFIV